MKKVLVGIVTYAGKDYVWDKFWNNIKGLSYPDYDVVIVDNSPTKKYYSKLKKRTKHDKNVKVYHVNRGSTSREGMSKSLNRLREHFIKGDYSHLMMIESDLIPPKDITERLMSHNVGVVGSLYLIGHAGSETEPPRPCLFSLDKENKGCTKNLMPDVGFKFFGKGLIKIHGCGFGSTLFQREVVEQFKFWYSLDEPIKHSDVLFYMDYHNAGYRAYVDTDLIVPHYASDWNSVTDV